MEEEEKVLTDEIKDRLWKEVVRKGRRQERGITNSLTKDEITTIVATADAFGCNPDFIGRIAFDLGVARYNLWDWIGMLLTDRYKGYGETETELKNAERFVRIMAELYAQYSIPEMITILREIDFDVPAFREKVYKRERIEVFVPEEYVRDWRRRLKEKVREAVEEEEEEF
jgi:hypothetical protein